MIPLYMFLNIVGIWLVEARGVLGLGIQRLQRWKFYDPDSNLGRSIRIFRLGKHRHIPSLRGSFISACMGEVRKFSIQKLDASLMDKLISSSVDRHRTLRIFPLTFFSTVAPQPSAAEPAYCDRFADRNPP